MVEKGGFGDVLILGVSGSDNLVAQTFLSLGAASASNLAVTSVNADLQSTYDAITAADIVWLRGGDQFQYVSNWKDTLTEQAIIDVYMNGGVVGGTSAGLHVLSEVVFDAAAGSLAPRQALRNPFHPFVTWDDEFLPLLPDALLDSHFTERARIGRLAVLLARYNEATGRDILAIGVDDRTALCVSPDMTAEIRGEGAVSFIHATEKTQLVLEPNQPPVATNLAHTQLTEGYRYDLNTRTVLERPANAELSPAPPTGSPQYTPTTLSGDAFLDPQKGEVYVVDGGDDLALFRGSLQVLDGDGLVERAVFATQVWNSNAFNENRVGGVQYALALNPHFLGLYLDGSVQADAAAPATINANGAGGFPESSLVVLDSHGMHSAAFSTYISAGSSVGPRQSVALEGVALHLIREGWSYNAHTHLPIAPLSADLNGDGAVDGADLAILLAQWGTDGPADLNDDGEVNGADLAILLANWTG